MTDKPDKKGGGLAPEKSKKSEPQKGKKYTLLTPLKLPDRVITEVEPKPLTGQDMIAAEAEMMASEGKDWNEVGSITRTIYLLARAIGLPAEDVKQMASVDIVGLQGFLS